MMITERVRDASFILTELPRTLSRDTVTLEGGHGLLDPGTVLGKISASGKYIASPASGSDGSQVAVAVLVSAIDTSAADVDAVAINWGAELIGSMLAYDASVDTDEARATKAEQLRGSFIKVR